ncbi:MAG TPA: LuxR C-terminal-related transcriptional regulator [Streptosporangiaceae bacterium]
MTCDSRIRGRQNEQEAIAGLIRRVGDGHGGVLLIEGEPGTGKTLLLAQAARNAQQGQVAVDTGLDDEMTGGWEERIGKQAAAGPLLVSLDDLQRAGRAPLCALATLPGRLTLGPVAWLLARRVPDKRGDDARCFDLLESQGADRLCLRPLGDDAVTSMVRDAVGAPPGPGLLAVAHGAAGNPLLLSELVAGLWEEDAIAVRDGQAVLRSKRVPRRVHAVVRRMLSEITPRTRHLLETTAVLGRSFRLRDAATMLGATPAALVPCVEEAVAAHVLVAGLDSLDFRQALVWQSLAEGLPRPVSQALHRQFGEILMARGGCAATAARHLMSGADLADAAALAQLDRAAAEVLPTLPEVAADLATRSLELTRPSDPARLARTTAAAEALAAAGQLDRATELARRALAVPVPAAAAAELRCALSSALLMRGQSAAALAEASAVLAEPAVTPPVRAGARTVLLQALAGLHDYRRAGQLAAEIVAAPDEDDCETIVTALVVLAGIMWDYGRLTEAMAVSANAVRMAAGQPTGMWRTHPHLFLGARLVDLRRLDEARAVLQVTSARLDALEPLGWSASPATLDARIALAAGRLDDAVDRAQAALSPAGPATRPDGSMARAVLATVAMRRGDLKAADEHLRGSRARCAKQAGHRVHAWECIVAAQVKEGIDGPRAATEAISAVYEELGNCRFLLLSDPACAAWLVRTALAAGDRSRAEAVAAAAAEMAQANPGLTVTEVSAAHACGLVHHDHDRLAFAADRQPDLWARASAAEDLAVAELGAGGRRAAISRLDQALEAYQGAEAARDSARVRRRLRRLGIRRGHWAAVSRPVSGWGSLTATERAVCDLITQGLTNRQAADQMFVSVHTVAFHLRQVFRKLGISSRVELARMAVEQATHSDDVRRG